VKSDEVGTGEHTLERVALHACLAKAIGRHERVVGNDPHLEPKGAAGDLLADPPVAEDAERLLGELHPSPLRPLPPSVHQGGVRLRDVPREGDEQADGVLGRRDDVRLRGVRDDDAPPGRRIDVDVVDADSRAPDHLQRVRGRNQVGCQLRGGADDDRVVVADPLEQVAVGPVHAEVDVEVLAQELDA
jgi:hypothetical protein